MGIFDRFRRKSLSATPGVVEALADGLINPYPVLGGTNTQSINFAYQRGLNASYGWIFGTQPAVRTVVDYIARNAAQLPLKLYERVDDDEREPRSDHPAARSMARPDGRTPGDTFLYRLITDFLIWDNAYCLKFRQDGSQKLTLLRIPPGGVTVAGGRFTPDEYVIWRTDGSYVTVAPSDVIHWYGYNPDDPLLGLSKLETLRETLAADKANQSAFVELAKTGLKGGYIERPLEAPEWDPADRDRFFEMWRVAKKRQDGRDPVLDEGMTFKQAGISPKDAEMLPNREFTQDEVAHEFGMEHCPPEDEAERQQFYADVLPPLVKSLQSQLCVDVLEAEYGLTDYYFEFDLNEKLRGEPEKRFAAITAAVGRPWLLVDEARAIENRSAVEGGDKLALPLNVALAGDQGSPMSPQLPAPNVMPPQDPNKPPQDGSYRAALEPAAKAVPGTVAPEDRLTHYGRRQAEMARQRRNVASLQQLLYAHYQRQARSLRGKAFDTARWNAELAKDLLELATRIVEREGHIYVGRLGGTDFDMRQVEGWLKGMASGVAAGINEATQRDVEAGTAQDAIERGMNQRAAVAGANIGARVTVFARREAAKQSPFPSHRVQTWIADTERHSNLDGASVPLGSDWGGIEPGSEPNCACSVEIS